jgi:hypothetical protein
MRPIRTGRPARRYLAQCPEVAHLLKPRRPLARPLTGVKLPAFRRLVNRPIEAMLVILRNEENDHDGQQDPRFDRMQPCPWNNAKLIGAKPPLRPKHVWLVRTELQIADRTRDSAMFNIAIDSKLRGRDVVALKVEDIAPHGYAVERATVRQKKTGLPVPFEVTEQTRQAVGDDIRAADKKAGEFLFAAPRWLGRGLSTRQYGRLVPEWIHSIGLDPRIVTGAPIPISVTSQRGLL